MTYIVPKELDFKKQNLVSNLKYIFKMAKNFKKILGVKYNRECRGRLLRVGGALERNAPGRT
jgi:hypothetical protein